MKALVIRKPQELVIDEINDPNITSEEDVIVQVEACGVCRTDFHLLHGLGFAKYPVIPGHEFVGRIFKMGKLAEKFFKVGQRVVVDPNLPCFLCEWCRKGYINLCLNPINIGVNKDGAFAEFVKVNFKQCYIIPEDVPKEVAILAEPLSCVIHGVETANVEKDEDILIVGGGPIGIIFYKVFHEILKMENVEIVEINTVRIELAQKIGVKNVSILPTKDKYDVIIETSGTLDGFNLGITHLRPRGRLVQFGVADKEVKGEVPLYEMYKNELKILGSFVNPYTMQKAVKILRDNIDIFKGIVTKEISLEELENLLKDSKSVTNDLKIMVKII